MIKRFLISTVFALPCVLPMTGQSLDPKHPAILKHGPNDSMVDSTVGTQYWYFWGGPGVTHIIARFRKNGQFDAGVKTPLSVDIYDEDRTWVTHKTISPQDELSEARLDGNLKDRTKVVISVSAPKGLLREGGDYELVVSGAVDLTPTASGGLQQDPIVRTYKSGNGVIKCLPNGTIESEDGSMGSWRLFDRESRVYVITVNNQRHSFKLMPGQGLVDPANPSSIEYREVR